MNENGTLDKLDNWLLSKGDNERTVIYIVAAALVACLIWLFVWEPSESFLATNQAQLKSTAQQLSAEENYLANNRPRVNILNSNIQSNTVALADTKSVNSYLDGKLKELSYLLFNDQSWAGFMDRLTKLAKDYGVKIVKIENMFLDKKELRSANVEQVLNVDVESIGNFHSTMKFLNSIEESQLVVDVYNSTISSSNRSNSVDSNIQIAVWGMLY